LAPFDISLQVTHKSIMGQVLDIQARSDPTLELFNMEMYQAIVKYKTAYYTFQLPVVLAMYLVSQFTLIFVCANLQAS
jgi:farnesyl diphosphate synthase